MSTRNRPRIVVALMVSLAALALTPKAALAHEGEGACSNASLKETIALSCSGTAGITPTSTGVPVTAVGVLTFNGKGGASGTQTVMANGALFLGPFASFTGTYTVNPDCTFSATFSPPGASMTNFDGAIFQSGFFAMETDAGTAVLCVQNKQ